MDYFRNFSSHEAAEGFLKSWGMILVSEIGDKTFFIAAVMAMKSSRVSVYGGAVGALACMTVLSAMMGWAAPNLISKKYTHYAATALFFFFGVRMLYESVFGEDKAGEELQEVEKELAEAERKPRFRTNNSFHANNPGTPTEIAAAASPKKARKDKTPALTRALRHFFSAVFLEAFVLTFLAEWGDRSQIATIGLAASEDVVGVTLGGIVGHAICTGAAVLGGRKLATYINERTVGIFGGVLFLVFGVHSLLERQ